MNTLFEKYGGIATFTQITQAFYHKVLDTPQLAHYFTNTNMEQLIDHQSQFLSHALGGPQPIKAIDLKAAHQHLKITEADFNLVAELLSETLQEMQVASDDINEIIAIIAKLKDQIISE